MTQEQISVWDAASSDTELISAVRKGATAAFGALYERHAGAARTVARQYMPSSAGADDVVADAFTKVLTILSGGGGPDTAFRAYLFTVVRRLAYVAVNQSRRMQPTDDAGFESVFGPSASSEEPALEGFERSTVARAYRALPERWQAALWYSEVEGLTPAEFASSLGLTANSAAALTYRAREGLRQQYLQQHLTSAPTEDCARTNPLLAGYVREALSKRDMALVNAHLESCGECRGLLVELADVSHGMRGVIAPLVLGLAGMAVIRGGLPLWGTAVATASTAGAGTSAGAGGTTAGGTASGVTAGGGSGLSVGASGAAGGSAVAGAGVVAGISAAGTASAAGTGATAGPGASGAATPATATPATATTGGATTGPAATGAGVGVHGTGAGASVAGTAASGTAASGIGAALAGLPALLVGAAAVVVVGAAVAISAALGVFSGSDEAVEPPNDAATSGGAGAGAGADAVPDQQTPTQVPSADPADPANTLVPDPARSADAGVAPSTGGGTSVTAAAPGATPSSSPTAGSTALPSPAASPTPTLEPTTDPTDPTDPSDATDPPASPADLQVSFDAGTTLVARQDNTVEISVSNQGGTVATNVAVALTVPETLRFISQDAVSSGVFGPRLLLTTADGWICADSGPRAGTHIVRCVVDEVAPGSDVTLKLAFYAEDAATADLAAQVFIGKEPVGNPWQFTSPVRAAPARLSATVAPVAALVAGQPGHVAVTVANGGQVMASDARVELTLPAGSGLTWRTAAARAEPNAPIGTMTPAGGSEIAPAPGSAPGWACSFALGLLTCAGPAVYGDGSASVILPVQVAAGSSFTGTIAPATSFLTSPEPVPAAVPSTLSVAPTGLSAASILQGPLQVAHVAGPLGSPLSLALPDGATVREATLVWSGRDVEGIDAAGLSAVELRTDAGGFTSEAISGRATVLAPVGAGPSGYWAAADVTALVAGHAEDGRWFVAPAPGTALLADLTWSLTVVYDRVDLPDATVTMLLGPPDEATPAAPSVSLPAAGPVRVAAVGTARDAAGLTVNGTLLVPIPAALPDVATFRSEGLLAVPADARAPLTLTIDPRATRFGVLAVHSSPAAGEPDPDLSGVLNQPQTSLAEPGVAVDAINTVPIGEGVTVPVTVRNTTSLDLTDVVVTFELPDGIAGRLATSVATNPTCKDDTLTCTIGLLAAGEANVVPLMLTAVDGLVSSGDVGYTVTGTDPVTGAPAHASGTFTVTSQTDLGVRGTWQGSVAVTEVGAPLMRCEPGAVSAGRACTLADDPTGGSAQNNHYVMTPLNAAGGATSSSSATVDLPAGATVKQAGLYWSANRKVGETFTQDLTSARLRGPGAVSYAAVTGEVLGQVSDSAGRVYYQSYADVTDAVAAQGGGEWSVADVALPALDYSVPTAGKDSYYAGWSLVVVYEDATLPPATVTVLDGAMAVTTQSTASFTFLDDEAGTATFGVVAWEGDRGVTGDQLLLNSAPLRPVLHGSTPEKAVLGQSTDAFNSTAWGSASRYGNSLGVDAKKFETRPVLAGQNTVSAKTTSDQYMIGVLTITNR